MLMWTAGVLGIALLLERHRILTGAQAHANKGFDALMLGVWFAWSIREGVRMSRIGKFSALDRQAWIVFTAITVVLGTLTIVSGLRQSVPPEWMATFWNAGLATGLLIVGLQASRLMTAGGGALLMSVVLAMVDPQSGYLWLAGGLLAGMVIPGLIFSFPHRPNR
jgi:hypothetical protein